MLAVILCEIRRIKQYLVDCSILKRPEYKLNVSETKH